MNTSLASYCIYTIVHVNELQRVHIAGGAGSFTENKKWVGGARLFRAAAAAGQRLPVLFADAATTDGLIYYALLTDVAILGDSVRGPTHYSFEDLTPIHPPIPKSALIKITGGEPLDDNYIRPYVLCNTPAFLLSDVKTKPVAQKGGILQGGSRKEKAKIYLFGYSGKTLDQIAQALGEDGLLIDIRYSPRSRKAGFSRSGMEHAFGERYRHVREFGNADYQAGGIRLADAEAGVQIIEALIAERNSPLFLMCSCEDGATCHRREVGKLLRKRGHSVAEYDFG